MARSIRLGDMITQITVEMPHKVRVAIFNGLLIGIIIFLNQQEQAFCVPTTWTHLVIDICFANTVLFPLLERTKAVYLSSFVQGISFFLFVYCIIFLEHMHFFIIFFGPILLIPHFFALQIIVKNFFKPVCPASKKYFLLAIAICAISVGIIGQSYKKAIQSIDAFEASGFTTLEKTFFNEKILGMHFIYHTRYCEYDGWRPPMHEPILVIGMWLNNRHDPLDVDLKTRLRLYKEFFPERPYKFDCSCGQIESNRYHNDGLWTQ